MCDNINVAIKCGPLLSKEKGAKPTWVIKDIQVLQLDGFGDSLGKPYCLDHIFTGESSNEDVYKEVLQPIVTLFMEGFNITIFTYGQISPRETYTMIGAGIIPRAVKDIFEYKRQHKERDCLIRCSYFQVYEEKISDLLNEPNKLINPNCNGTSVVSSRGVIVTSVSAVLNLMREGNRNLKIKGKSGDCHIVFRITMEYKELVKGSDKSEGNIKWSDFNFIDFTQSDRQGVNINKPKIVFYQLEIQKLKLDMINNFKYGCTETPANSPTESDILGDCASFTTTSQYSARGDGSLSQGEDDTPEVAEEWFKHEEDGNLGHTVEEEKSLQEITFDLDMTANLLRDLAIKEEISEENLSELEQYEKQMDTYAKAQKEMYPVHTIENLEKQIEGFRKQIEQNVAEKATLMEAKFKLENTVVELKNKMDILIEVNLGILDKTNQKHFVHSTSQTCLSGDPISWASGYDKTITKQKKKTNPPQKETEILKTHYMWLKQLQKKKGMSLTDKEKLVQTILDYESHNEKLNADLNTLTDFKSKCQDEIKQLKNQVSYFKNENRSLNEVVENLKKDITFEKAQSLLWENRMSEIITLLNPRQSGANENKDNATKVLETFKYLQTNQKKNEKLIKKLRKEIAVLETTIKNHTEKIEQHQLLSIVPSSVAAT